MLFVNVPCLHLQSLTQSWFLVSGRCHASLQPQDGVLVQVSANTVSAHSQPGLAPWAPGWRLMEGRDSRLLDPPTQLPLPLSVPHYDWIRWDPPELGAGGQPPGGSRRGSVASGYPTPSISQPDSSPRGSVASAAQLRAPWPSPLA